MQTQYFTVELKYQGEEKIYLGIFSHGQIDELRAILSRFPKKGNRVMLDDELIDAIIEWYLRAYAVENALFDRSKLDRELTAHSAIELLAEPLPANAMAH